MRSKKSSESNWADQLVKQIEAQRREVRDDEARLKASKGRLEATLSRIRKAIDESGLTIR